MSTANGSTTTDGAQSAQKRLYNFSAGPATLPTSVLHEVQDELLCYPGVGASIMEISHRSPTFVEILETAQSDLRSLIGIGDDYEVLFLQGGSALQFSMVPANLIGDTGRAGHYLVTGSWSKKAITEAKKEGEAVTAYDASASNFDHVPQFDESSASDYDVPNDSAMLYYCSNETIQGVQFQSEPWCPDGVPRACDASSDFLSRPIDITRYGLLYACAQKNAGPAGVTVVIMRRDLLERSPARLAGYMNYANHAGAQSMWNTPPTFAIYVMGKIIRWVRDQCGGLESMAETNRRKAAMIYDVIDANPEFYQGHAKPDCRSMMNATFKFANEDLLSEFIQQAAEHDLTALKGHRSVGGIRASLYNAMPVEGVEILASFMKDFVAQHG